MASTSMEPKENGSQTESSPFIVLHEMTTPDADMKVPPHRIEDNSISAMDVHHAQHVPPSAPSPMGHAPSEPVQGNPTPLPPAPRAERTRAQRGNRANKLKDRENTLPRPQTSGHQSNPDNWSLGDSPIAMHSPLHGPMHARHGSTSDRAYTDPSSQSQVGSYPSPGQFSNHPRPVEEWAANSWSTQFGGSGVSPSAMTFDGRFPPGPHQPPFSNGLQPTDMARAHSGTSHFSPPPFIQTNFSTPSAVPMIPFSNPPLSGYELLAAKLAGNLGGPSIKPIYRRFEALNHRLMLHLQDELSELEDQLKALDAADTQTRQHSGGILPASRRLESPNPNAPSSQRTELLGRIGYKICQYHQVITSFREIQELPSPTMPEVQEYRTYLAAGHPVVDEEERFLDVVDDLARLSTGQERGGGFTTETVYTPMPRSNIEEVGFPPDHRVPNPKEPQQPARQPVSEAQANAFGQVALAMVAAVLAPILTFVIIPGFVGRMTVALLVGGGVSAALMQTDVLKHFVNGGGVTECIIAATVYGVAMAVIASAMK